MKKLKRLSSKEYKFVYSRTPRLCVDVLIFTKKGLLLSRRDIPPFAGLWHFPGGRVFYKESISDAIKRIAQEEIGVKVKIEETLGYNESLKEGPYVHSDAIVFAAKIKSGVIRGSEQAREIRAFRAIPADTNPYQKKFLKNNWDKIQQLLRASAVK